MIMIKGGLTEQKTKTNKQQDKAILSYFVFPEMTAKKLTPNVPTEFTPGRKRGKSRCSDVGVSPFVLLSCTSKNCAKLTTYNSGH